MHRSRTPFFGLAALAAAAIVPTQAHAIAVASSPVVSEPILQLYNVGLNSDGFGTGEMIRFGATSVVPNGAAGTNGVATTVNLATGLNFTRSITFNPGPAVPNLFSRTVAYDPHLTGPWTLTFSNGSGATSQTLSLPSGATEVPFVSSITLSGTSLNPTFSWTPPSGTTINGYRINIYDKALIDHTAGSINNGNVVTRNIGTNTSYTVNAADFTVAGYAFDPSHNYSIEISAMQTRDGSSSNLGNGNVYAMSRVYADFSPSAANGSVVNLPVAVNGTYQFNMAVTAGQTYYIDPLVATGYVYQTGANDPNFSSVVLPTGIGDGLYDLFGFDSNNAPMLLMHNLAGGQVYDFGTGGVSRFEVLGIEPGAGLDPANTTAFVTGLTFTGAGTFTGTQTPITINVVAEPTLLSLLGLGLVLLPCLRRKPGA